MSATLLLVAFAFGQPQPEKAVTDNEKKEFLKLLATLPTRGEFFAEEAIPKAAPYTRVLLALTDKDLEKYEFNEPWTFDSPRLFSITRKSRTNPSSTRWNTPPAGHKRRNLPGQRGILSAFTFP